MPRQARLDAPGALHHMMVRGINKTEIFSEAKDKKMFIERLSAAVIEGQCAIYAWAVMDNHSHILFRSGKQGISEVRSVCRNSLGCRPCRIAVSTRPGKMLSVFNPLSERVPNMIFRKITRKRIDCSA